MGATNEFSCSGGILAAELVDDAGAGDWGKPYARVSPGKIAMVQRIAISDRKVPNLRSAIMAVSFFFEVSFGQPQGQRQLGVSLIARSAEAAVVFWVDSDDHALESLIDYP
jgi:hypothetical protein